MRIMLYCGIIFNSVFLTSTFLYRKQLRDEVKVLVIIYIKPIIIKSKFDYAV